MACNKTRKPRGSPTVGHPDDRPIGARLRNFKLVLIAVCCLHGLISGGHVLDLYRNSWYGYTAADGSPKRVFPAEQIIGVALGAATIALSFSLFVRNRWLTVLLVVATVGMFAFNRRSDGGSVLSAIGELVTIAWYVPQIVMLLVVLALTWGDQRGLRELVRSLRIEAPGLGGAVREGHHAFREQDQPGGEGEDGRA